jgi:hypothetical protein
MDGRAYLERAGRSQPANRGCVHIVGPGDIGLDLALSESLGSLLPLVWRQLPRPTKSHALGLRTGTAVTCRARISSRSNSASPSRIVSISRPCGVVVSAQASDSDLKPAPALRVTTSMSPASRRRISLASSGRSSRPTPSRRRPYKFCRLALPSPVCCIAQTAGRSLVSCEMAAAPRARAVALHRATARFTAGRPKKRRNVFQVMLRRQIVGAPFGCRPKAVPLICQFPRGLRNSTHRRSPLDRRG